MGKQTDLLLQKVPRKTHTYASNKDEWKIPLPLINVIDPTSKVLPRTMTAYKVPVDPDDLVAGTFTSKNIPH